MLVAYQNQSMIFSPQNKRQLTGRLRKHTYAYWKNLGSKTFEPLIGEFVAEAADG